MPSYCRWTWDDRFHVALIVIDQKDMEAVFSAVINCFVEQWDYRTIAEASVKVRNLLASLFEVKPGQVVFTSDEGVDSVLLAAWWPWANGRVISLRVGIFSCEDKRFSEGSVRNRMMEWFGIEGG